MIDNIPSELLDTEQLPNDFSILIGENGSGKSFLLNKLSKHFLKNDKDVIAIANSIHDKFEAGHKNFNSLRGRTGRRQCRMTIKNALLQIAESDLQRLKNATQALKYVGFDPVIGFKIDKLDDNFREKLYNSDIDNNDKSRIIFLIEKILKDTVEDEIIWLEIETFSFSELQKTSLIELFIWEKKLKQLGVLKRFEVFLRKKQNIISMLDASSGELVLITSIVYLATLITENTVILIDEPENSLHPKWQKEYTKIILDIFYYFQPKVIIATHSPLIINGAELFIESPKIFKAENFTFELQHRELLNVEEIFFSFFNVTTPQNRFLSDRIVRYLNVLANKKITYEGFVSEIEKIERSSYDPKQLEVLRAVINIASEISLETSN